MVDTNKNKSPGSVTTWTPLDVGSSGIVWPWFPKFSEYMNNNKISDADSISRYLFCTLVEVLWSLLTIVFYPLFRVIQLLLTPIRKILPSLAIGLSLIPDSFYEAVSNLLDSLRVILYHLGNTLLGITEIFIGLILYNGEFHNWKDKIDFHPGDWLSIFEWKQLPLSESDLGLHGSVSQVDVDRARSKTTSPVWGDSFFAKKIDDFFGYFKATDSIIGTLFARIIWPILDIAVLGVMIEIVVPLLVNLGTVFVKTFSFNYFFKTYSYLDCIKNMADCLIRKPFRMIAIVSNDIALLIRGCFGLVWVLATKLFVEPVEAIGHALTKAFGTSGKATPPGVPSKNYGSEGFAVPAEHGDGDEVLSGENNMPPLTRTPEV